MATLRTWARHIRTAACAAVLAGSLAPAPSGCAGPASQLEQGHAITTGKQPYDEFFESVRRLREDSLKSEQQALDARAELARAVEVEPKTDATATLEATRARVEKLRASGVLLHIDLLPEARLTSTRGKRTVEEEDMRIIGAIEACLKGSLEAAKQLGELAKRAQDLETKRTALQAELEAAFKDRPKRREVAREIFAAEDLIAEAQALGDKSGGTTSKFVLDLARAVETGASPDDRGTKASPDATRAVALPKPLRRGGGAPAPPKASPSPTQQGADDFDP